MDLQEIAKLIDSFTSEEIEKICKGMPLRSLKEDNWVITDSNMEHHALGHGHICVTNEYIQSRWLDLHMGSNLHSIMTEDLQAIATKLLDSRRPTVTRQPRLSLILDE